MNLRSGITTALASTMFFASCGDSPQTEAEPAVDPWPPPQVEDFVRQHSARIPWQDFSPSNSRVVYSLDLERELVGGRPVVFIARLDDVSSRDSLYLALFETRTWGRVSQPRLRLRLRVRESLLEELLEARVEPWFEDFLLAARVEKVHRASLGYYVDSSYEGEVQFTPEIPTTFLADGELVDFLFVEGGIPEPPHPAR